jgi:cytochrome c peroxidase
LAFWLVLPALVGVGCRPDPSEGDAKPKLFDLQLPAHFPDMVSLEGNELTEDRVELGRRLFYDKRLSRTSDVACATCHQQKKAFTDGLPLSKGVEGRLAGRNAPSLANVGYLPNLNWDGGVRFLEEHVNVPILDQREMGNKSWQDVLNRIRGDELYPQMFRRAYGVDTPSVQAILRAISAFQRTIISGRSKFDQYFVTIDRRTGLGDSTIFTPSEWLGFRIFIGERAECHHWLVFRLHRHWAW